MKNGCFCDKWCRQFWLILWKNIILQVRRPIGTIFEICLPIAAVVLLVALRLGLFSAEERCFSVFQSDALQLQREVGIISENNTYFKRIHFTPNLSDHVAVMKMAAVQLNAGVEFVGVGSEFDIESEGVQVDNDLTACGNYTGVILPANLSSSELTVTIRPRHEVGNRNTWRTSLTGPRLSTPGPRAENLYTSEGFVQVQNAITRAILLWRLNQSGIASDDSSLLSVSLKQLPYPKYTDDLFLSRAVGLLPMLVILGFLYSAGIFIKELVLEKETRLRESMKMMGLKGSVLWCAWFVKQFLFLFFIGIIITILLKFGRIFPQSGFLVLFIFMLLFFLSFIAFGYLVSAFFTSARLSLYVGSLLWFLTFIPYFFLFINIDATPLAAKVAVCLLTNTCVGLGFNTIATLEVRGEGLTWQNLAQPLSNDDRFSVAIVFGMLILDSLLYFLIAWYKEGVFPGKYGVPKPFYFPFQPSYWLGRPFRNKIRAAEPAELGFEMHANTGTEEDSTVRPSILMDTLQNGQAEREAHEPEPTGLKRGISIANLTKVYRTGRTKKKAVDKLNLNMYEGQITVLLGHNGAGKTTTMSILTGLFTPTSGDAVINDYSILTDMDTIRQNLGLCPQHNVLFDRLTVREHLNLFGRLKGVSGNELKKEVNQLLKDIQLQNKEKVIASSLSGGMKRKLSVAIALVGGSQFVILDEPTSGMDPYARRATWDLLAKYKRNRTILLTTHFMDEADLLGDRIAIMAEGKLLCSGSSLFLKGRYGIGYHLTVVKAKSCNVSSVIDMITTTVSGAQNTTDVAAELSFVLPSASTPQFPDLFTLLEDHKEKLGIVSYGLSVTTMEEVFMKVGEGVDETAIQETFVHGRKDNYMAPTKKATAPSEDTPDNRSTVTSSTNITEPRDTHDTSNGLVNTANEGEQGYEEVTLSFPGPLDEEESEEQFTEVSRDKIHLNSGVLLWLQQYRAMFTKHALNGIRHIAALIIQLALPTVFVLLALIFAKTTPNRLTPDPARTLIITNSIPLQSNTKLFTADMRTNLPDFFKDIQASPFGVSSTINITQAVNEVIKGVEDTFINASNAVDCCHFENQILNQYCASLDLNQECNSIGHFGYHSCSNCLSCCTSTSSQPSTCSKEGFVFNDRDVCPTPPRLAIGQSSYSSGPVDDITAFIAEHLLRSAGTNFDRYEREYQLGFTLEDEPFNPLEVCSNLPIIFSVLESPPLINTQNISLWSAISGLCRDEEAEFVSVSSRYSVDTNPNATTIAREGATVWYSNENYHLAPAALSAFYNYYFGQVKDKYTNWTNPLNSLTFVNHPLPRTAEGEVEQANLEFIGYSISVIVTFGISFLLASFTLFLVQERSSKAKHLQFVGGVHTSSYWLGTFSWDLLNSLPTILLTVILFAAFQIEQFQGLNLLAIFILLVLVCWSGIPSVYCFSFLFNSHLVAFSLAVSLFFFVPLLLGIIRFFVSVDYADASEVLDYIFMIFPTYSFYRGIELIYTNDFLRKLCTQNSFSERACEINGIVYVNNVLDAVAVPGIGACCLFMATSGVFLFLFTLLIERSFFIPELLSMVSYSSGKISNIVRDEDYDVSAERDRINGGDNTKEDVIIIKNLSKTYRGELINCYTASKKAVDAICLGVGGNECFGLLGVNGAGKTSTFKILTGDISPSSGTATISGFDIKTNLREVQQRIGYCPQFDALLERLTGVELLTMFARLRGVPEGMIPQLVQAEIKRLDLTKYAKKRSGTYSGGNKRKLSTAIALVGDTPIVLLDEPSTGMDPTTRRHLWDALTKLVKRGKSIVLTSHSMEECEALCTRLAIMVNGQFKCLGSIQHLKSNFGKGLTLVIRTSPCDPSEGSVFVHHAITGQDSSVAISPSQANVSAQVMSFIAQTFPGARLLESHQCTATFHLPSEGMSWAYIFQQIESNKVALAIEDYSVSQTTLDQVFINFAKEQLEE